MAALATAIVLYSLWVISVNGAISSDDLISETGTALSPLAIKIGGSVSILGFIYVILAMGIGTVHFSYGLYYQIREALPSNVKRTIQFLISVAPIFLLFILVEWMLLTNRESFSWLLGIIGVLLVPILGGIFPMLMLAASRRKGDYAPKLSLGFLGNRVVLIIVYLIYLGSVFIYGFFIWEDPIQRVIAIGVGIVVLIVTYLVIRQGAFSSRVVIVLKVEISDTDERATMAIIDKGKPLTGTFRFVYVNGEQSISGTEVEIPAYKQLKNIFIEFSSVSSKEMKVWLHRVTPEGNSEPISAALRIKDGGADAAVQLDPKTSQVIMPLTSRVSGLEITLL